VIGLTVVLGGVVVGAVVVGAVVVGAVVVGVVVLGGVVVGAVVVGGVVVGVVVSGELQAAKERIRVAMIEMAITALTTLRDIRYFLITMYLLNCRFCGLKTYRDYIPLY
jgi:hypothetical protein